MFELKVPLASRSDRRTTRPSGLPFPLTGFQSPWRTRRIMGHQRDNEALGGSAVCTSDRNTTYVHVDVHEGHGHRNSQAVRKLVLCHIEGRARHLLPAWGGARAGAAAASGGSCCAHMGVMSFRTRCVAKGPCSQGLPKRRLTRPPPCPRPSSHLGRAWASGASR